MSNKWLHRLLLRIGRLVKYSFRYWIDREPNQICLQAYMKTRYHKQSKAFALSPETQVNIPALQVWLPKTSGTHGIEGGGSCYRGEPQVREHNSVVVQYTENDIDHS